MIKKLIILLLMLTSIKSYAQESVVFKVEVQPNKRYKSEIATKTNTEIEFVANQASEDKTKNDVNRPRMIMENESIIQTDMITQARNNDKEIPFTIEYGKLSSKMTFNGETKTTENPISGTKILGRYDINNKVKVDSVVGDQVTQQLKEILTSTMETVQAAITFPEKPMKVGDTFNNEIPLKIPMAGAGEISFNIKSSFLLTGIKENIAFFNIQQTLSLDMNQEKLDIVASGTGVGSSEYNIDESYLTKYKAELPMDITISTNDNTTMSMKMNVLSEQTVMIE